MKSVIQGALGLVALLSAMGGYHLYIESSIAGEVQEVIKYIDQSRIQDRIMDLQTRVKELETKRRYTELNRWEAEELEYKRQELRELCQAHRHLCL